jgi:hypothetical protein
MTFDATAFRKKKSSCRYQRSSITNLLAESDWGYLISFTRQHLGMVQKIILARYFGVLFTDAVRILYIAGGLGSSLKTTLFEKLISIIPAAGCLKMLNFLVYPINFVRI